MITLTVTTLPAEHRTLDGRCHGVASRARARSGRPLRALLLPLVACLSLSACGIKLAYNNADRLVAWQVDGAIGLERDQSKWLNQWLDEQHAWHRRHELPQYADGLRDLAVRIENGMSMTDVLWFEALLETWWQQLLARGSPGVIHLLQSLDAEQVERLLASMRDEVDEYVDEYGEEDPVKWRKRWVERMREAVERLTGRLGREQVAVLEQFSERIAPDDRLWAQYRYNWLDGFERLMAIRASEPTSFAERFLAMASDREAWYSESFVVIESANDRQYRQLAVALSQALSVRQRQRTLIELRSLATTLDELAAR